MTSPNCLIICSVLTSVEMQSEDSVYRNLNEELFNYLVNMISKCYWSFLYSALQQLTPGKINKSLKAPFEIYHFLFN